MKCYLDIDLWLATWGKEFSVSKKGVNVGAESGDALEQKASVWALYLDKGRQCERRQTFSAVARRIVGMP